MIVCYLYRELIKKRCFQMINRIVLSMFMLLSTFCLGAQVVHDNDESYFSRLSIWRVRMDDEWAVVTTVPTGGWEIEIDNIIDDGLRFDVYLTITRPGPDCMVTQAFTSISTKVGVPSDHPITLHARVGRVDRNKREIAYKRVITMPDPGLIDIRPIKG